MSLRGGVIDVTEGWKHHMMYDITEEWWYHMMYFVTEGAELYDVR